MLFISWLSCDVTPHLDGATRLSSIAWQSFILKFVQMLIQ